MNILKSTFLKSMDRQNVALLGQKAAISCDGTQISSTSADIYPESRMVRTRSSCYLAVHVFSHVVNSHEERLTSILQPTPYLRFNLLRVVGDTVHREVRIGTRLST